MKPSGSTWSNSSSAHRRSRSRCCSCAFMGGMALGSWLLPKLTPRARIHSSVVAALEAGIALFGIAIPLALPYIQQGYLTLAEPGAGRITTSRDGVLPRPHATNDVDGSDAAGDRAVAGAAAQTRSRSEYFYMANLTGGATGTVPRRLLPAARLRHGHRDSSRSHAQSGHRRGVVSACTRRR